MYKDFYKLHIDRMPIPKLYNKSKEWDIKEKKTQWKWDTDLKREFAKQETQVSEKNSKILNILHREGNVNQKYSEISSYTSQNS